MSDLYSTGQPIRLSTTVRDIAGTITDPTALVLTYGPQGGSPATKHWPTPAEITRDSTGVFHYEIAATLGAGHYQYLWTATGTAAGEDGDVFDVFDPATYPRLVSFADAKTFLRITGSNDDDVLDRMIGWASARILREVQGNVTTVTDRITANGWVFTLPSVPVQTITAITAVTATTRAVDVTALSVQSRLGGVIQAYPTWLAGVYDVTYTAGTTGTPVGVDGATFALLRHWWNQLQAHGSATYGDAGFIPDFKGLPNLVQNMLAATPPAPPLMA